MAASPLWEGGGAAVLGFLACACVVRKAAFVGVGGFSELLFFVGEERLLAYDLATAGRSEPGQEKDMMATRQAADSQMTVVLITRNRGTAERLAPDAPVPVVDCHRERHRAGGAGLAAVLADLDVVLITARGDDGHGGRLRDLLSGHVEVVRMPLHGGTPCKIRIRASGRPVARLDRRPRRAAAAPAGRAVERALRSAGAILVADYGRGVAAHPRLREIGRARPDRAARAGAARRRPARPGTWWRTSGGVADGSWPPAAASTCCPPGTWGCCGRAAGWATAWSCA